MLNTRTRKSARRTKTPEIGNEFPISGRGVAKRRAYNFRHCDTLSHVRRLTQGARCGTMRADREREALRPAPIAKENQAMSKRKQATAQALVVVHEPPVPAPVSEEQQALDNAEIDADNAKPHSV